MKLFGDDINAPMISINPSGQCSVEQIIIPLNKVYYEFSFHVFFLLVEVQQLMENCFANVHSLVIPMLRESWTSGD